MIAIVPARGGSKGLPRKNILPLAGRPMVVHTIAAALEAGAFSRVVVSSDDEEILEVARRAGALGWRRPAELATDGASSLDVIRHVLDEPEARGERAFALLQPTSPLRTARHIREAIGQMAAAGAPACVSVTPCEHHPFKALVESRDGQLVPVRAADDLVTPRQALPRAVAPNGAIYLSRTASFRATGSLMPEGTHWYTMSAADSIDVDDELSFSLAETVMTRARERVREAADSGMRGRA